MRNTVLHLSGIHLPFHVKANAFQSQCSPSRTPQASAMTQYSQKLKLTGQVFLLMATIATVRLLVLEKEDLVCIRIQTFRNAFLFP